MSGNLDAATARQTAEDLATKSQQSLGDAADQAKQAGAQAREAAGDVAGQAKATGASIAGQLKDQAASTVDGAKAGIADRLEDVAEAAHKSGQQLEGHQDFVAGLIERGANELGTLASTLRNNDLSGLVSNVKDLANRQPALFTGLSIAAGFALVRLGKIAVAGASREDLPKMPNLAGAAQAPDAQNAQAPQSE